MNKFTLSPLAALAALSLTAVLAACGGGGSSSAAAPTADSVPGAPVIVSATAGDGSASIAFTAPASAGNSAISVYTATCTAQGTTAVTASATASPVTVSGLSNGASYACAVTATNAKGTGAASAMIDVTPVAGPAIDPITGTSIDPTRVPVGDGKVSTTMPQVGYVYACTTPDSPNPPGKSPWISDDGLTWNSLAKISVQGAVAWTSVFSTDLVADVLTISGNGLPSHVTGTFPVSTGDPAYAYDKNPNAIASVAINWGLPASPVVAAQPTCTRLGAVGVLLSGARIFNALDADGRDAGAHEVQDSCDGHPQGIGTYHYHSLSRCVTQTSTAGAHSPLVGYIADGFGLYGNQGEGGKALTNADLDECHGHSHQISVNGVMKNQYHYHATREYPYTVGCYKGTPAVIH